MADLLGRALIGPIMGKIGASLLDRGFNYLRDSSVGRGVAKWAGAALPFLKTLGITADQAKAASNTQGQFKKHFTNIGKFVDDKIPHDMKVKDGQSAGDVIKQAISKGISNFIDHSSKVAGDDGGHGGAPPDQVMIDENGGEK